MMNNKLLVDVGHIKTLLSCRKMQWSDLELAFLPEDAGLTLSLDIEEIERISTLLSVPRDILLESAQEAGRDLEHGVKVGRKSGQYERVAQKNGIPSYHYRHVLKTPAEPYLMALRTSPLFFRDDDVVLNEGHQSKEFVYVLKGQVKMHWQKNNGPVRQSTLSEGDSVYIDSWIKHAFSKVIDNSEILVVDYR